jgi:hypothetical protein
MPPDHLRQILKRLIPRLAGRDNVVTMVVRIPAAGLFIVRNLNPVHGARRGS